MKIDWRKMDGLVPAVVQDADSGQLLMLAYMNEAALQQTQETGRVTFFSRSKQRLWMKGETSGHVLDFVSVAVDCDGDALRVMARPNGPVCHLGLATCFGNEIEPGLSFLAQLERVVNGRAEADPNESYTAALLQGPISRLAQKVGEEGVETALAAVTEDDDALLGECADLAYHMIVMLSARGLSLQAVVKTLRDRHGAG